MLDEESEAVHPIIHRILSVNKQILIHPHK